LTALALAVKAIVALGLCAAVGWSVAMALDLLLIAVCLAAYLLFLPKSGASTLLMAKTAAVILLFNILPPYLADLSAESITRFLRVVFCAIALSLMLGLAGIGHDRYGDEDNVLRANGFFAAGNELNIVLLGLFWWLSACRRSARRDTVDTLLYGLCLVLLVISGSKTTIAGAAVILLRFLRLKPGSILLLLLIALAAALVVVNTPIWDRWTFFFDIYADNGILSGLTNGRFSRPLDLFEEWSEVPWTGLGIFALGWGYIESDPLDLLFNFGLFGVTLFILFCASVWRACQGATVLWLLVLAASVVAGHVAYSVFAAPILVAAFRASRLAEEGARWPR
jgi:hypothetical protein